MINQLKFLMINQLSVLIINLPKFYLHNLLLPSYYYNLEINHF
jgi:hypothetical protein